jgi:inosine/xanthosine triphosphatase
MKIIVASQNPVKLEAVKQAFGLVFGELGLEIFSVEAPSGVSDQPMDVRETAEGALNRAKNIQHHEADYVVGIEGGLSFVKPLDSEYGFEQTWAAVIDCASGKSEVASGPAFPIPHHVIELIRSGKNLTDAMAATYGTVDLGQKEGDNGWISDNNVDRTEASKLAVLLALCTLKKELI